MQQKEEYFQALKNILKNLNFEKLELEGQFQIKT
jgi:hypothetical protein